MKWCPRLAVALALCIFTMNAAGASSGASPQVRVMLNAEATGSADLTAERLDALRSLAGMALEPSGRTRTGALEFALPDGMTSDDASRAVVRLRGDRSVLWAETVNATAAAKAQRKEVSILRGRKLMVKLAPAPRPTGQSCFPASAA